MNIWPAVGRGVGCGDGRRGGEGEEEDAEVKRKGGEWRRGVEGAVGKL